MLGYMLPFGLLLWLEVFGLVAFDSVTLLMCFYYVFGIWCCFVNVFCSVWFIFLLSFCSVSVGGWCCFFIMWSVVCLMKTAKQIEFDFDWLCINNYTLFTFMETLWVPVERKVSGSPKHFEDHESPFGDFIVIYLRIQLFDLHRINRLCTQQHKKKTIRFI